MAIGADSGPAEPTPSVTATTSGTLTAQVSPRDPNPSASVTKNPGGGSRCVLANNEVPLESSTRNACATSPPQSGFTASTGSPTTSATPAATRPDTVAGVAPQSPTAATSCHHKRHHTPSWRQSNRSPRSDTRSGHTDVRGLICPTRSQSPPDNRCHLVVTDTFPGTASSHAVGSVG